MKIETIDESIEILNTIVRIRIAPSFIHGVGLFAMRFIPKGTKLNIDMYPQVYKVPYEDFNKLMPDVRELLLERWPQIVNGSAFMWPDSKLQAYMNHDPNPNYDCQKDKLIKDVQKGEEITENYKKIKGWEKVYSWLK